MDEPRDPGTDPHHDLARYPQDAQARQPGERWGRWAARRCAGTDAPPQPGDPGSPATPDTTDTTRR